MQRESVACINNFLHHHHLNLPHPPCHPLRQSVESLYELVRANVRKVDGNGSPLKNAVFGVWDDPKCDESDKRPLATLTTGADGLSQEGEPENKKNMMEEGDI